jgi:hypothetical protein
MVRFRPPEERASPMERGEKEMERRWKGAGVICWRAGREEEAVEERVAVDVRDVGAVELEEETPPIHTTPSLTP